MFCKNCGKEFGDGQKFCTNCGAASSSVSHQEAKTKSVTAFSVGGAGSKINISKIVTVFVAVAIIGWVVYINLDEDAIQKNNEGLTSFDSGDSQTAINQFQQAAEDAITNDAKIQTLKNLGYVYATEGQNAQALTAFKEALELTKKDTFDYYLISAEIALLEFKPNAALLSFNKAYELNPVDFQVNNSLALFYLDLEEIAPQYVDYPKALSLAKKAYEYDVEKSEISKQNLAIAHLLNENFDQAISLLSTTNLNQHPHGAYWLGLAYLGKEDHTNAKFYLQKALNAGVEMPQEILDYLNS